MRQLMKFLHSVASCGVIGGLAAYALVLAKAPQATAAQYADVRRTIEAICDIDLVPSVALALVTGLLAMAVHRPYQQRRCAWVKAATGIGMFESTFAITQSKAHTATVIAQKIAAGEAPADALATALNSEWTTLWAIMAIALANVALGVWRPKHEGRRPRMHADVRSGGARSLAGEAPREQA